MAPSVMSDTFTNGNATKPNSNPSSEVTTQLNDLVRDVKSGIRQELREALKASLIGQYQNAVISDIKSGLRIEVDNNNQTTEPVEASKPKTQTAPVLYPPPPSIFTPICHPLVEQATREVDGYYLANWPFENEKARKKFVAAGFSRVTCLYFPKALNERINFACSLLTILFLIDDQLEHMSLSDGKAYNESLMPLCRGDTQPDRTVPVQWMMYDLWAEMRSCDEELARSVEEPVFEFMRAQTAEERLRIRSFGAYLEYRQADVGQGLLAALGRFSMALHLTPADLASLTPLDKNTGRHISIINDIYSYEKELQSSKTGHAEGGYLCSAVPIFADETELSIPAAKNVLYALAREWEVVHRQLVMQVEEGGCKEDVRRYMEGLEFHMSGNELWSRETKRYSQV